MNKKINKVSYLFVLTLILLLTFVSAPQCMMEVPTDDDTAIPPKGVSNLQVPTDRMQSLMQEVFSNFSDSDNDSNVSTSASSLDEDHVDKESSVDLFDRVLQEEAAQKRKPKTCQHACAGVSAAGLLFPTGVLMSGFGNLSYYMVVYGIHNSTPPINGTHILNAIVPLVPLYQEVSDPDMIGQTIGMAIPPTVILSFWAYHGVDWVIPRVLNPKKTLLSLWKRTSCFTKKEKNNSPTGWKVSLLEAAYSKPVIWVDTLVCNGFFFNMIATQISHAEGVFGGNAVAYSLASLFMPLSTYVFGYLNSNLHKHPLYPQTKEQEQAFGKLSTIKYVAEKSAVTNVTELKELWQVLENPSGYTEDARNKQLSVTNKSKPEDLESIKYWHMLKHNIALSSSALFAPFAAGGGCWVVYSLTNKLSSIGEASPDTAKISAAVATSALAVPLALGAVRSMRPSYNIAMLVLDGFKPEVSGYYGQRIAPLLALGFSFWYFDIPAAYSFQREIEYNPYASCTNYNLTYPFQGGIGDNHYPGYYTNHTNCTGGYVGDMGLGARFTNAALFTASKVLPATFLLFYTPLERTARWAAKKVSYCCTAEVGSCWDAQKKTIFVTEKLRNIKNRIFDWVIAPEANEDTNLIR